MVWVNFGVQQKQLTVDSMLVEKDTGDIVVGGVIVNHVNWEKT
jgi:hypothetical protein